MDIPLIVEYESLTGFNIILMREADTLALVYRLCMELLRGA